MYNMIESLFLKKKMDVCRTPAELSLRLCQPLDNSLVVILVIADREDLSNILSMRILLQDTRTVLVLPDRQSEALAGNLNPRHLAFADSEYLIVEIASVLKAMLEIIYLYKKEVVISGWHNRIRRWMADKKIQLH